MDTQKNKKNKPEMSNPLMLIGTIVQKFNVIDQYFLCDTSYDKFDLKKTTWPRMPLFGEVSQHNLLTY